MQRVPKGERRGRVHSSTVTVAVLWKGDTEISSQPTIDEADIEIAWYSGSGAGGQHRNKHMNSVRLRHGPTGLVRTAQCRAREDSYRNALAALTDAVHAMERSGRARDVNRARKRQIGSGMRGDKIRTWRYQDGLVVDHRTGAKTQIERVRAGDWNGLIGGDSAHASAKRPI